MKTETKPAPSRKERKLQREIARLEAGLAQGNAAVTAGTNAAAEARKYAEFYADKAVRLREGNDALERENEALKQTARIAAEGLRIERDELLARARRIELRILGLGFSL